MSHDTERIVEGRVELPPGVQLPASASLYVRVEDVSRVDGLARRLGQQVFRGLSGKDLAAGSVAFSLTVPDPGPGSSCAVRAHLDIDGDGAVSRGDYVSTERFPVPGGEGGGPLRITLKRVD